MRIENLLLLDKLKSKNQGNVKLIKAINKLIEDIENHQFVSWEELKAVRKDADRVHNDGFYFFNIHVHRTMIMIELEPEGEATIVWAGSHQEYESVFKNNKNTIERWLRSYDWIE
jgi:mRNA interferase HigB